MHTGDKVDTVDKVETGQQDLVANLSRSTLSLKLNMFNSVDFVESG